MAASVARHILAPIWYTASDKKPIPTQGREKLDAQGKPTSWWKKPDKCWYGIDSVPSIPNAAGILYCVYYIIVESEVVSSYETAATTGCQRRVM